LQRGKRSIVLDLKRSNDLANRDPMQARRRVCASVGIPPKDCRVPFRSWLGPARPQG
jgi:hypothetical protein